MKRLSWLETGAGNYSTKELVAGNRTLLASIHNTGTSFEVKIIDNANRSLVSHLDNFTTLALAKKKAKLALISLGVVFTSEVRIGGRDLEAEVFDAANATTRVALGGGENLF